MIWIGYTTLYREGGPKFERAALTLSTDKRAQNPGQVVRCDRVESKRDFVDAMARIRSDGVTLDELHFVGHSGMYGPMFRTTAMPEQFSPHEWRELAAATALPFAPDGRAYFHACRTARWFAPFFARTFGVPAHGYHWYTTISVRPDAFAWEGPNDEPNRPLYVIACPGKKSHGALGTVMKYGGLATAEAMKRFDPAPANADGSYDAVAGLYDDVFADIGVRDDEWRWLCRAFADSGTDMGLPRVLDIGCGNGALLTKLRDRIATGTGVDKSHGMIERACARAAAHPHLSFTAIDGPHLPFADASFDVVVSLLSFRYLDWDPIMNEIRRVLAPGGRILIVDMVTVPLQIRELPRYARSKARQVLSQSRNRSFDVALRGMVRDPRWQKMLNHNPIRAEHEMRWYLQSRYPGREVEVLNLGWNTRILAFDSGPLQPGWVPPQSYP